MEKLKASKLIDVRFSEVDSMKIVWHGSYPLYFEDAREAFGKQYELEYLRIYDNGYYAPLVDMEYHFRKPLRYGQQARIDIIYQPTEAAKIVFDYEIHDAVTDELLVTGKTVQVFLDLNYELQWESPAFFEDWKKRWNV